MSEANFVPIAEHQPEQLLYIALELQLGSGAVAYFG